MSNRLTWLLLATIVAVAAGTYVIFQQQPEQTQSEQLMGDFRQNAQQLDEIRIADANGIILHAKQKNGQWQSIAQSSNGFPVAEQKLSELLQGLLDAKLYEMKTARAENYARLGVEGLDAQDSQSVRIELTAGNAYWHLLVGNRASNGSGHFVRQPQKLQSWLLDRTLSLPEDSVDWLQQPIWSVEPETITRIERAGDQGWVLERTEEGGFALQNMPANRELVYDSVLDGVSSTLASLRFTELAVFEPAMWQTYTLQSSLNVSLSDGQSVTVEVATDDAENHFLQLTSATGNEYWQQWQYTISSFTAQQLSKSIEDFLAEPVEQGSDDTQAN
ncbi:DUF4340 domain-containing protein [Aestuariibacter salexigens]|uniref:DUF4340 domain-containing protein n=1 Tax=Aestuariibacter salexigens TaxID=226010 RepID=UPI000427BAC8|nr:DUF4340 domain-containing protein [Aestuariibacter salexigens]